MIFTWLVVRGHGVSLDGGAEVGGSDLAATGGAKGETSLCGFPALVILF